MPSNSGMKRRNSENEVVPTMSQGDGERHMRRTVDPTGDRIGKLKTEKTTGSEGS